MTEVTLITGHHLPVTGFTNDNKTGSARTSLATAIP